MDRTADVHLTLPADLLTSFDQVARERGLRRVSLMREVIEDCVKQARAQRIDSEIDSYVDALADASDEFVRETEDHTAERLLRETEW